MDDCVFCKIVKGEIPSSMVYEDDIICAFKDISPMAPVHVIFIPKEHIVNADGITAENSKTIARIFEVIPQVAKELGVEGEYRVVTNCGREAGQSVFHLHFHLLGGVRLTTKFA